MLEQVLAQDWANLKMAIMVRVAIVFATLIIIIFACLIDFWSGCSTAKALGQKLNSHGFRKTVDKISDYFKISCVGIFIDLLGSIFTWYQYPYASILVALAVLGIEGMSVWENMKRKKANAALIPTIVAKIIECKDHKDATTIFKEIGAIVDAVNKNEKWKAESSNSKGSHPPNE